MRYAAYNLTVDVTKNSVVFYKKCDVGLEIIVSLDTLPSCKKYARKGNFTRTNDRVIGQILEAYMNVPELQEYL